MIVEELDRAGLPDWERDVDLAGVEVAQREEHNWQDNGEWKSEIRETTSTPLQVDLVNQQNHIAIEYVSAEDFLDLGGIRSGSTVQGYDMQEIAQHVSAAVDQQGDNVYFGALYDPVVNYEWTSSWETARAISIEEAKALLREQVRDFVEWLEGQGAL